MSEWKPKPKNDAKTEDMNLTGEEGFVLSRIDGFTSVKSLVSLTGLPEGRVKQIVQKLVRQGAVETEAPAAAAEPPPRVGPAGRAPSSSSSSAARGGGAPDPSLGGATTVDEISPEELREILGENTQGDGDTGDAFAADETIEQTLPAAVVPAGIELPAAAADGAAPAAVEGVEEAQLDTPEPPPDGDDNDGADADADGASADEAAAADEAGGAEGEAKADDEEEVANYRKLFNETLSKLEAAEREARAKSGQDPELMALCFDPLPAVIRALFENSRAGMAHARMVARHHHTPQGLDVVMARPEFFRDAQVQRFLLQNTMLQEPQLKRMLQSKRLADVYKISISREIPERNRQKSRNVLRSKWSTAEGEERAGLVFTTEGRCLIQLTGLPFDSQTTMYLCQKTYNSNLLIQNLARFGATPPQVLVHLLRQPAVKRQQHLRTLIKQHPNCPADAKRQA